MARPRPWAEWPRARPGVTSAAGSSAWTLSTYHASSGPLNERLAEGEDDLGDEEPAPCGESTKPKQAGDVGEAGEDQHRTPPQVSASPPVGSSSAPVSNHEAGEERSDGADRQPRASSSRTLTGIVRRPGSSAARPGARTPAHQRSVTPHLPRRDGAAVDADDLAFGGAGGLVAVAFDHLADLGAEAGEPLGVHAHAGIVRAAASIHVCVPVAGSSTNAVRSSEKRPICQWTSRPTIAQLAGSSAKPAASTPRARRRARQRRRRPAGWSGSSSTNPKRAS